jgi:biopolymer transport protein ExbD
MSHSAGSEVKSEPNLTPILDMVFQLITFFMLVINFKSAEMDMTLNLPVIGSARPVADHGEGVLVLNVKNVGGQPAVTFYGRTLLGADQVRGYLAGEGHASMMKQKLTREDIDSGKGELKETIVIRADDRTPFGDVNLVVTACQEQGYRKFALKALNFRSHNR